jgi:hypothetical protein
MKETSLTLDEKLKVVLSKRLRAYFPQAALESDFVPYGGGDDPSPERLAEPLPDFLRYHREVIFKA